MKQKISPKTISIVFSVLVVCFAVGSYIYGAWTEPTVVPPGGNVSAPINVGTTGQIKSGALRVAGLTVDSSAYLATTSGNVGIGTTGPSAPLDINKSSISDYQTYLEFDAGTYNNLGEQGISFKGNAGANEFSRISSYAFNAIRELRFWVDNVGTITQRMVITNTGNVGIGTAGPQSRLDVEGGAVIGATYSGTNPAPSNGLLVEGNVGIGTASPGYKLDVNGDINLPATGFLRIAGNAGLSGQVLARTATGMAWQAAAAGGVTSLSAGTGITLSPNPITSTGTISASTTYLQRRVTDTCAANQAIRVINADGTVTCVSLPPSAICTWGSKTYSTGAQCCASGFIDWWVCNAGGTWSRTGVMCPGAFYACGT